MNHPFIGDLSHLSMDDLVEKVSTLTKNMAYCTRSGNYAMANQIQMVLENYRAELNRQQRKLLEDDEAITGKIDIS